MMKQLCVFLFISTLFAKSVVGQISTSSKHQYYFELNGASDKATIKVLETAIRKKETVTILMGHGIPRKFYILESKTPITQTQLQSWIGISFTITKFNTSKYAEQEVIQLKMKS